jgi:hypothetical protein
MGESKRRLHVFGLQLLLCTLLWSETTLAQGVPANLETESSVNLLSNPGFEVMKPAFWEATGAGAEWTRTASRTPDWSLSLAGSDVAQWTQNEAVRIWGSGFPQAGNPQVEVGGWVKMEGVNTDPASDDEKFQLLFEFFEDASRMQHRPGGPIVLDLPQDRATTERWVEVVSGPISFPYELASRSARVTFRKGGLTTGIAFLDDLFIRNANETAAGWTGNFFNSNMDVGDEWGYWWNGHSLGRADWPARQPHVVTVSDEDAHSGRYSLRVEANGSNPFEAVGVSERIPVDEGEPIQVSFWVKYSGNADQESIGTDLNNLGLTAHWFDNLEGGAAGYGQIGGIDIVLDGRLDDRLIPLLGQAGEWMHYAFVLYPSPSAVGLEIRPRYWHEFQGVTYWDDFFVAPVAAYTKVPPQQGLPNNPDY